MHVIGTEIGDSPRSGKFTRVTVEIGLRKKSDRLVYWFDLPSEYRESVSSNGNPWLILMVPIACAFNESIDLSYPVDPRLLRNLHGLQRLWTSWFPSLHRVEINAPVEAIPDTAGPPADRRMSAAFFSGGIDSFFTLLRHHDKAEGDGTFILDDLITVSGFNFPIGDLDALAASLIPVAEHFGKNLILMSTNLRYSEQGIQTPYSNASDMILLSHGAALGICGHLLGRRYREILIASSADYGNLIPYGSHPLSDPLLSSQSLRVVHDGASFTRVEKTAVIAESDFALSALHVCWQDRPSGNCSRCAKCLRTMATLDVVGASRKATSFDWSAYGAGRLARVWLPDRADVDEFIEVAREASARGRNDIVEAVMSSVRYSRRKQRILSLINANAVSRRSWQAVRRVRQSLRSGAFARASAKRSERVQGRMPP